MLRGNWHGEPLGSGTRHLEILGGAARRQHHRRATGDEVEEGIARSLRPLHGDGHGVDHDLGRRNARPHAARRGFDSGGRRQPSAHGERQRPAHRRDGVGGSEAFRFSDARNRSTTRSSAMHALSGSTNAMIHLIAMAGRAGVDARRSSASTSSRARRRCSRTSGPPAQVPDGGFLLRRRPARAAERARRPAESRLPDRQRQDARREHRGREDLQRRRDPHARRIRCRRPAGSRCCAATSRPTAR